VSETKLDALDRKILAALQENNLTPADRLGDRVGLSASAVQRRVKRLRQEGIIAADVSVVDPKKVGQAATFIVEVTLERESTELFEAFKRRMHAAPEVQQCYYITGDADFVLVVTASDVPEYEKVVERLFFHDRNIRRFRTGVVLNRVKASLAVPILGDDD
jgi:Lrp/AsnC family leucine-responsive transcriptional regulator